MGRPIESFGWILVINVDLLTVIARDMGRGTRDGGRGTYPGILFKFFSRVTRPLSLFPFFFLRLQHTLMADPIIRLEKVSIFQKNNMVLSNVNFSLEKGEFVYLLGKNGSGKSSLMRTLYVDIPRQQGEMHIEGYDLSKIKRKEIPFLRRKIGIVFQDF